MPLPPPPKVSSVFYVEHGIDKFVDKPQLERQKECSIRSYQLDAARAVKNWFKNDKLPSTALVVLPTGAGKSGVVVLAPYVTKSSRVLVITPSETISEQLHRDFNGDDTGNTSAFLIRTNLFNPEHAASIVPNSCLVKDAYQIPGAIRSNVHLLIANAHKFGTSERNKVKINDIPDDSYDLIIVDEAHHYPAKTWNGIVDHFPDSKKLFLTATPYHHLTGGNILPKMNLCFELKREEGVKSKFLRPFEFIPIRGQGVAQQTALAVIFKLIEHDTKDPSRCHKALILCQTKRDLNSIEQMMEAFSGDGSYVQPYTGDQTPAERATIMQQFKTGSVRILLICRMLMEGFDHNLISVVAIYRNVAPNSRVLFGQFVGRAVRRIDDADCVPATIIAHEIFKQDTNYEQLDEMVTDDIDLTDD